MPSPFIGGRIPQDLHDALQKHITESGEKLPQVLQKALSNYLGYIPVTNQNHSELEERIASLEISFRELREAFEKIQQASVSAKTGGDEASPSGQLSLLGSDNSSVIKSVIKSVIEDEDTDNDSDIIIDNSHAGSDIKADSNSDIIGQELTHEQVAKMVGKTVGAVRSNHGRKRILENEIYKYVPGGRPNHPKWIVEKR